MYFGNFLIWLVLDGGENNENTVEKLYKTEIHFPELFAKINVILKTCNLVPLNEISWMSRKVTKFQIQLTVSSLSISG